MVVWYIEHLNAINVFGIEFLGAGGHVSRLYFIFEYLQSNDMVNNIFFVLRGRSIHRSSTCLIILEMIQLSNIIKNDITSLFFAGRGLNKRDFKIILNLGMKHYFQICIPSLDDNERRVTPCDYNRHANGMLLVC